MLMLSVNGGVFVFMWCVSWHILLVEDKWAASVVSTLTCQPGSHVFQSPSMWGFKKKYFFLIRLHSQVSPA